MAVARPGRLAERERAPSAWGARWRWLGHPAFLVAVVALAVNDHVLKDRYPGWWTGKLSDVAGLAVVGTVAGVLIGPRRGPLLAAIGFTLLKTAPGAAELARPILGGVTARDETDLLALAVLVPLARTLRASSAAGGPRSSRPRPRNGARLRTRLSAALPLAGAIVAVVTATATSCGPGPAVVAVSAGDGVLYALVERGWRDAQWARSDDGGRTWRLAETVPAAVRADVRPHEIFEDPGPTGPQTACVADGTCWRLRGRRAIERQSADGNRVEEFRLTDAGFSAISTGCAGGQIGVLGSVASADGPGGPVLVASYGADGILVRQRDGRWVQARVLSVPPVEASTAEAFVSRAILLLGPILAALIWPIGRRRWPSWQTGLAAIGVGWFTTLAAAGAIAFLAGRDTDPERMIGRAGVVGMIVTATVAIVIARRPVARRATSPPSTPPRPDAAPPPRGAGRIR